MSYIKKKNGTLHIATFIFSKQKQKTPHAYKKDMTLQIKAKISSHRYRRLHPKAKIFSCGYKRLFRRKLSSSHVYRKIDSQGP